MSVSRFFKNLGSGGVFYTRLGTWAIVYPVVACMWVVNGLTSAVAAMGEVFNLLVGGSGTLLVHERFRFLVKWQLNNYFWNTLYYKSPDVDGFTPGDPIDDDANVTGIQYARYLENEETVEALDNRAGRHAVAVIAQDAGRQFHYVLEARRSNRNQELPPFAAFLVALVSSSLGFAVSLINIAFRVVFAPVSLLNLVVTVVRSGCGHMTYHIAPSDAVQSDENIVTSDFFWDGVYYIPRSVDDIF